MRLKNERDNKIENTLLQILSESKEIKKSIMEYNFHLKMDNVDLSEYFPFNTDGDLNRFMRNDEGWNQRKKVLIY